MAKKFECNESKALISAVKSSARRGKLFDLNSWKIKRENQRVKLKVKCKKYGEK